MFHLIPPILHRFLLRIAHALRILWWRWAKPDLSGVNVLILSGEGKVLLVRHSYEAEKWTLPGGGLQRGELPAAAVSRELSEELDCAVAELTPIGVDDNQLYGARCVTHVFACTVSGEPQVDGREVIEAAYYDPYSPPPSRTGIVDRSLRMLQQR